MKKLSLMLTILLLPFMVVSCKQSNDANLEAEKIAQMTQEPIQSKTQDGFEKAYFASGCFWCVEAIYESVDGVKDAISGYSGGKVQNPTYKNHADHAEAVEIIYNPEQVTYATLVDVYFGSQNVTQVNGQGPDRGTSYRSIVFYQNETQKKIIDQKISELNRELIDGKVAAQVLPFQKFWIAEEYHQNYEKNNPENPYVQSVSIPRLERFRDKFPQLLKKD